ncbi:MAG: hypothetical protein QOD74_412 [Variibacter sp.]|jgi:hypothetical protein|nr:hypothetical protein [Variibacter sp.]
MSAVEVRSELGFSDRVLELLERVDYRRADTADEREAIFRLRHDAYVREGAVTSNVARRFTDDYDDWDNAYTFGLYVDGRLASSFRMHVSTPEHPDIPAAHVFPDLLRGDIEAGRTIIDPTRFVADATLTRVYPELPYATVRLGYMAAEFFRADSVLATVRAEHQAFYRRIFGHRLVCPPRAYPTLSKPISLMTLHYPPARLQIMARYPFFRSTVFERRMLFERATARRSVVAA